MANQTSQATDLVLEETCVLLERIFPSPRSFSINLWGQAEIPAESKAGFTLELNHPGALRRIFTPPIELSAGEAYIYGDFDIEGDIYAFYELLNGLVSHNFSPSEAASLIKDIQRLPNIGPQHQIARQPAKLHGRLHSKERDMEATRFHYNVGNEFYALWLDRLMQYSCGYFPTGTEDLDTAQEKKIEHICRKLRLKPGERLLDIGCGWGGLAITAAQRYGVNVVGVTLSDKQAAYAQQKISSLGLGEQVRIDV